MKKTWIHIIVATAILSTVWGCGGGGGGGTVSTPPVVVTNTVSGVASKGIISGGTVSAYRIVNGVRESQPIITGTTSSTGAYQLNIGTYTGPLMVEITGGTYTDEATGNTLATIPSSAPLRVAIPNATGTVSAAITPLTELAVKISGTLDASAISAANLKVATLFKLTDIITTQPVAPTSVALASATTAQRDYTLALATISQIGETQIKSVDQVITLLQAGISGSAFNSATIGAIQSAVVEYFKPVNLNPNNTTGVTDPANTSVITIGATRVQVKLSTTVSLPAGTRITGIETTLNLPSGVSLKSGSDGIVDSTVLYSSGKSGSGDSVYGYYSGGVLRINLISGATIDAGEFLTILFDKAYNAPNPLSAFTVGTSTVIGFNDLSDPKTFTISPTPSITASVLEITQ